MKIVYLPVEIETGKVDYEYLQFDLQESDGIPTDEWLELKEGWEYRLFKITRADRL